MKSIEDHGERRVCRSFHCEGLRTSTSGTLYKFVLIFRLILNYRHLYSTIPEVLVHLYGPLAKYSNIRELVKELGIERHRLVTLLRHLFKELHDRKLELIAERVWWRSGTAPVLFDELILYFPIFYVDFWAGYHYLFGSCVHSINSSNIFCWMQI
jgi:hypothetical protein